jgi:sterol desaturase/sphingolipid hydroxylase (fatty acid hydroxylase superfamily)
MFFGAGIIIYLSYLFRNRQKLSILECLGLQEFRDAAFKKSLYMDFTMYIIGKLTDFVAMAPYVAMNLTASKLVTSAVSVCLPNYQSIEFSYFWAALCTVLMFLAAEFSEYGFHFVEHKTPFLWEFHKVHHSAHQLNPLTAKRNHPVSLLLGGASRGFMTGLAAGIIVSVFGISMIEALALSLVASKIFIIATLDPLKHSHYNISLGAFDRLLISPHMHQIHHSKQKAHWDKNFGTNLSIFDWAFGTAYKPRRGEKPVYGISGHSREKLQSYNTLYGAYIVPIIRAANMVRRHFRKGVPAKPTGTQTENQAAEALAVLNQQEFVPEVKSGGNNRVLHTGSDT